MQKKSCIVLGALVCLSFLFNGTMTQKISTSGREKPEVDCSGSLQDKEGHRYPRIENITIAGLYKQIKTYPKPKNNYQNPTKHRAYLDPQELTRIKVLDTVVYNKQTFLELEVTRKDGTLDRYLIEPNRVVRYDIPTVNGHENREIDIEAIDIITFEECIQKPLPTEAQNNQEKRTCNA